MQDRQLARVYRRFPEEPERARVLGLRAQAVVVGDVRVPHRAGRRPRGRA
jgi:hypothetical protein